jgi:hypothetical protein
VSFVDPRLVAHAEADAVLRSAPRDEGSASQAREVLLGLALCDSDRAFVEHWCVRVAECAPDADLRAVTCLSIGHLARRFRTVGADAATLVRRMADDPATVARMPQVLDARDDLERFANQPGSGA